VKYKTKATNKFKKNLKLCIKRGCNRKLLDDVVGMLENGIPLPAKYNAHKLKGKYKRCWECHIEPDWLLIWQQKDKELILMLTNTGTHSDLY
jgi:mRNA interferase YafQ